MFLCTSENQLQFQEPTLNKFFDILDQYWADASDEELDDMLALEDRTEMLALKDGAASDGYDDFPDEEDIAATLHDAAAPEGDDGVAAGDGGEASEASSSAGLVVVETSGPEKVQGKACPSNEKQQLFGEPKVVLDVETLRSLVEARKERLRPVRRDDEVGDAVKL